MLSSTCNGAQELRNPVEHKPDDGDLPGEGEAQRDSGVDVPSADIGSGSDQDGNGKPMSDGDDEQAPGFQITNRVDLLIRHHRSNADEHEQEQRDELRQRALERVWAGGLIRLSECQLHHR